MLKEINRQQNQYGAGLVEVIVSLLILAVGLLGVLSLQANGLSSSQRAVFVTEAQLLAQDMADRILAFGSTDSMVGNDGVRDGGYGTIDVSKVTSVTITNNCSAICDSDATILFDTEQWQQALSASSLPRARGIVSWVDPIYTISVRWDQDRAGDLEIACTSSNCFEMEIRP